MNTPNTSKLISFLLATGLAGSTATAATLTGSGSLITESNWSAAFTSTGNIGGVDYFGYNNQHADITGAFSATLGADEWFRQDTSIAGYQFRMTNAGALVTVGAGGRLTAGAGFALSGGSVVQNGGLVEAGSFSLSYAAATASSYTLNDGTLAISGGLIAQPTGTDSAVITVNGGTMTVGTDSYLRARSNGDVSTFNVAGGNVTFSGALHLGLSGWGATQGSNTINLSAGTLRVDGGLIGDPDKIGGQVVNFNGGTLATRPTASSPIFGTATGAQVWNVNNASTFELQSGATQNITVFPTMVLNDTLTFKNSDADNLFVMAGPAITGNGGLAFEGANSDAARFQFQGGVNTFSGGATINSGYVRLNVGTTGTPVTAGGLGTGTITFGNQGDSTLLLNYTTGDAQNAIQVDAGANTNTIITPGARSANMNIAFGTGINLDGNLTIDNQGTGINLVGQVTGGGKLIAKDGILQMQSTGNTVAEVVVQNGAELRNNGDNLSNGGRVTVESGGLWGIGGKNFSIGSIAGGGTISVQVNRGLTIGWDNTDTEFSGVLESTANAVAGSAYHNKTGTGTTTFSGNNTFEQYMNVGEGTLKLGSANALGATTKEFDGSAAWTLVQGTGSLDLNGQVIGNEQILLRSTGGGNGGLTNSSASAASLTGTVQVDSGAVPASIAGTGAITLSTVNVFGNATLNILNDALTITTLNVASGSTIGGTGTLTGNLTFADGAQFIFSETDTLTVDGGTLDLGNLSVASLVGLDNTTTIGAYTLIDGTATFDFTGVQNLGSGNAFDLGAGISAYFTEGSLILNVVPEPQAFALLGGLLALSAVMLRRRTR